MSKTNTITLIYAGGTIGMQPINGELAPPKNEHDFEEACAVVTKEFSDKYGITINFVYFDKKDSTERNPQDWTNLYSQILSLHTKSMAVVVAHGTDTLANSASAISFAFTNPNNPNQSSQHIPIIFTASQQPIYQNGGDGKFNLFHSLETAHHLAKANINRVVVSFWDKVLLGTRALKTHDKRYNAFDSPATQTIGQITSSGVELSPFISSLTYNPTISTPQFAQGVTTVEISPSTPPGVITTLAQLKSTKVLVLKTLGEGNIPKRFISEIHDQTQKQKIIVLASPFAGGSVGRSVYKLGAEAIRAGAIPAGDMVPPAVDTKCSWLVGNMVSKRDEFATKLQTDYVGEITQTN